MRSPSRGIDVRVPNPLAVGCVLVSIALGSSARASETSQRSLGLREAVELALAHNYDLAIERLSPEVAEADSVAARSAYVPNIVASASTRRSDDLLFDATTGQTTGTTSATTSSLAIGVSGALPTGATYSVTTGLSRSTIDRDLLATSTSVRTTSAAADVAVAEIRQPLLRGRAIDADRLAIARSDIGLEIASLALVARAQATASAVEQAYFDLVAARHTLEVQRTTLDLARRTLEDTLARLAIGTIAPLDEKEAQSLVAASEADLVDARRVLRERENTLKLLLTSDFSSWRSLELVPADTLDEAYRESNYEHSAALALTERLDLRTYALAVEDSTLSARYSSDRRLPQLDLVGSLGSSGTSDSTSGAWSSLRDADQPSAGIGLTLSIPWTNRRAAADSRAADTLVRQAELRYQQARETVLGQIDTAVFAVETNHQRIVATREARAFAEAALAAEQDKLSAGRSTTFVVLQLQRNLAAARASEIEALAAYNKALSVLRLREGTTLAAWPDLTAALAHTLPRSS
ncbi:TolC family protein [Congregicoccus parvus]|uniref:TolC family protein n=1 Tax=Congregicoccus parvus TaxID=3081749 RepID=UPI003FA5C001